MNLKGRFVLTLMGCIAILIVAFVLDLTLGPVSIPIYKVFGVLAGGENANEAFHSIVLQIRLPKALTAATCGAGLSLAGLLTQTMFRNPLAGPDVLGLSAGASLAVALVVLGNLGSNMWTISTAAAIGAGLSFAIILAISRKIASNSSLLIVGLMIAAIASSIVGVLQYISRQSDLQLYMIWTMGNISSVNASELWIVLGWLTVGVGLSFSTLKSLNAWALGESYSQTLGLNPKAFRWKTLLSTCLITGSITAFCGPISFIGIAVPHLVKRIFPTNNHQHLIPLTLVCGAVLLLICDILTLIPGNGISLPINAATAIFGAPVIIWIVVRSKREFF